MKTKKICLHCYLTDPREGLETPPPGDDHLYWIQVRTPGGLWCDRTGFSYYPHALATLTTTLRDSEVARLVSRTHNVLIIGA